MRVLDLQPPFRALPKVEYVKGSVLDRDLVRRAMDGVDEVYHLAGLPGMWLPRKDDFHAVNCGGTEIVIAAARKRGVEALPALLDGIHPFPCLAIERCARGRCVAARRHAGSIYALENARGAATRCRLRHPDFRS